MCVRDLVLLYMSVCVVALWCVLIIAPQRLRCCIILATSTHSQSKTDNRHVGFIYHTYKVGPPRQLSWLLTPLSMLMVYGRYRHNSTE